MPDFSQFKGGHGPSGPMVKTPLGILSSAVIVLVCHYTVFMQCAKSLLGGCFMVISNCQN